MLKSPVIEHFLLLFLILSILFDIISMKSLILAFGGLCVTQINLGSLILLISINKTCVSSLLCDKSCRIIKLYVSETF